MWCGLMLTLALAVLVIGVVVGTLPLVAGRRRPPGD
jgi:hypothetical protein